MAKRVPRQQDYGSLPWRRDLRWRIARSHRGCAYRTNLTPSDKRTKIEHAGAQRAELLTHLREEVGQRELLVQMVSVCPRYQRLFHERRSAAWRL